MTYLFCVVSTSMKWSYVYAVCRPEGRAAQSIKKRG